jgi:serine/threonine-protein kinase
MDNTNLDPTDPAPRAASEPVAEPRSLGPYRILRRLGEGGMGAVYLAYDEANKTQVALKVLSDQLSNNPGYIARFYREAQSSEGLHHPNIVRSLGVGQDPGTRQHYLVLEFVDGFSAHALLDQTGRLSVGDAVHIALGVARALEHAHSRNIVHRDIKPDNILIARSGVARLADFGLAKKTDENSHLTAARQGFGTSYYMPYEQALNAKQADGRSDIYALGATLYHLLTGVVPFTGDSHLEVVEKKGRGEYAPASALNPEVPPLLDQMLARMLARDPVGRYQTASELIIHLEKSRLAAPLPSFADPDLALQDPWIRACLATTAQPTRPDPDSSGLHATPAEATKDQWRVRYRNRSGSLCHAKATTQQIVQRINQGRLPADMEATPLGEDGFRPLREYPEFASLPLSRPRRKGRHVVNQTPRPPAVPTPSEEADRPRWMLAGAGLGVAFLAALILIYLFWIKR